MCEVGNVGMDGGGRTAVGEGVQVSAFHLKCGWEWV